jgi:hypothetical protein
MDLISVFTFLQEHGMAIFIMVNKLFLLFFHSLLIILYDNFQFEFNRK